MRRLALVLAAAALGGCAQLTLTQADPWPTLTVREHPDELGFCWRQMSAARKLASVLLLAPPSGCSWVNLCQRTCDVYYPSHAVPCADQDWGCMGAAAVREHELAHCTGGVHGDPMAEPHYRYWIEGRCDPPAPEAPVVAREVP